MYVCHVMYVWNAFVVIEFCHCAYARQTDAGDLNVAALPEVALETCRSVVHFLQGPHGCNEDDRDPVQRSSSKGTGVTSVATAACSSGSEQMLAAKL